MHLIAVGGSDAGISAALRARELDPSVEVTVVVADAFPNFSICGIPYYVSGDVTDWHQLAHRTTADLSATGMEVRVDTVAREIRPAEHQLVVRSRGSREEVLSYDALVVGTGATSVRPQIEGLTGQDALGSQDGVHLLHSMGDTFELMRTLESGVKSALIVGAGYIGLEMAEGLSRRGLAVTQLEQLSEVLPAVDPELGAIIHRELESHGVDLRCNTAVKAIARAGEGARGRLRVEAAGADGPETHITDVVLVVVGVQPDTDLARSAGTLTGARGAIAVDRAMRTNLPDVFAAGDCAVTYHRLLGDTYLPLGTTSHKQGRVAGENAIGGNRHFPGSLGTQVVKVFDLVAARTGLGGHEAVAAGLTPVTIACEADDHKAYYPDSRKIAMRYTGERTSGRLLGVQLVGHRDSEIAKRIDIAAVSLFHAMAIDDISDLDLSYTPPLGSPWDALQVGAQAWVSRRESFEEKGALGHR